MTLIYVGHFSTFKYGGTLPVLLLTQGANYVKQATGNNAAYGEGVYIPVIPNTFE